MAHYSRGCYSDVGDASLAECVREGLGGQQLQRALWPKKVN